MAIASNLAWPESQEDADALVETFRRAVERGGIRSFAYEAAADSLVTCRIEFYVLRPVSDEAPAAKQAHLSAIRAMKLISTGGRQAR